MGPNSWQGAGEGAAGDSGGGFNWGAMGGSGGGGLAGPVSGILGGLFGNAGQPYQDAMNQYTQYANQSIGVQQPFYNAGTSAIPQYQNWLNSQQNAPGYINSLMGQYQESPYAKYLQQQAMRAGTNAASASGLTGSTPFAQQMAQTSAGISSGDLNNWLSQVLGINRQYGQGLGQQVGWGQGAANQMSGTYNQLGQDMAQATADQDKANQNQQSGLWNGIFGLGSDILGGFGL